MRGWVVLAAWKLIVLIVCCFTATALGVSIFTRWARRARLLDVPNHRSSHEVPVPRGAGVVIVAVVAAAVLWLMPAWTVPAMIVAGAAGLIVLVSAIDDLRSLPSGLRLGVHVAGAVVAVVGLLGASPSLTPQAALLGLGVVWLVGLTNAYNFMDGIDGISGAQAVVAGVAAYVAAVSAGLAAEATMGVAVAASSAGFLWHNWSPARVFMGDVGSAFLGFAFGVLALAVGAASTPLGMAVALSLWPFLFDTGLTFLRRAARGENVLESHRSHLYQRLVIAGCPHSRVALLYGLAAAAGAAAALLWARGGAPAMILILIPVMAGAIWLLVIRQEAAGRAAGRMGRNAAASSGP